MIPISGFDPDGDPEIRRMADGSLLLVFNFMPPSWVPEDDSEDLGCGRDLDSQLSKALGVEALWEDREFLVIRRPIAGTVEAIKTFLAEFRRRHDT